MISYAGAAAQGDGRKGALEPAPRGISWIGPGRTAFAGVVGKESGPLRDAARALAGAGGTTPIVLEDARFEDPAWIGEDAGPGERTGIHALCDMEDVGTIVLALNGRRGTTGPSPALGALLEAARLRPDIFFLALDRDESLEPITFPLRNAALFHGAARAAGQLLRALEEADFREEPAFRETLPARGRRSELPPGLRGDACIFIEAWRRWEGLRRSIDIGTRWVIFEIEHFSTLRSVERDVAAFLHRLGRNGFLARRGGAPVFQVTCERSSRPPGPREDGDAAPPSVTLRVEASLAPPHGPHLAAFSPLRGTIQLPGSLNSEAQALL
ncbi:MAG TPA: hypothetical protein VMT52_08175 [Planctomycetota bacterium]|nr:hypothetical protein [Planctomycetota bacterium]